MALFTMQKDHKSCSYPLQGWLQWDGGCVGQLSTLLILESGGIVVGITAIWGMLELTPQLVKYHDEFNCSTNFFQFWHCPIS